MFSIGKKRRRTVHLLSVLMNQFLDKILYKDIYFRALLVESVVILALGAILLLLVFLVRKSKFRSLWFMVICFILCVSILQYSNLCKAVVLAVAPYDNRVKFEFKVSQPLDDTKATIAFVGSSQANRAIDEDILNRELFGASGGGAVVDLHYPGMTPGALLETMRHYDMAQRYGLIIYYMTDRDFLIDPSGSVCNPGKQDGLIGLVQKELPVWTSESIVASLMGDAFVSPSKFMWDRSYATNDDDEEQRRIKNFISGFKETNYQEGVGALGGIVDYCQSNDIKLVICVGWTNPRAVGDSIWRSKLVSLAEKLQRENTAVYYFDNEFSVSVEDFTDLTHTTSAFQEKHSLELADFLKRRGLISNEGVH